MKSNYQKALTWHNEGHEVAIATVIETWGSSPRPVGAQMVMRGDGHFEGSVSGGCVEGAVITQALEAIKLQIPRIVKYGIKSSDPFDAGLACGGNITILIEPDIPQKLLEDLAAAEANQRIVDYKINLTHWNRAVVDGEVSRSKISDPVFILALRPPKRLIIIGAVHIAQFLLPMAKLVGFETVLIDNREVFGSAARFEGEKIITQWPSDALLALKINSQTAIVTLTHDDKFDIPALDIALGSNAFYIGALGSRKTQASRNRVLETQGHDTRRIHGPVGLNIWACSPAEIAVSIMAEIIMSANSHE